MNKHGYWSNSIPPEIDQLLNEPNPLWDWQVREVDEEEWIVARLIDNNHCERVVAGKIAVAVEDPPTGKGIHALIPTGPEDDQ